MILQERSLASSGNANLRTMATGHRRDFFPVVTGGHNYEGGKGLRNRRMGVLKM